MKKKGVYQHKMKIRCENVDKWKMEINICTPDKNKDSDHFYVEKGVEKAGLSTSYTQFVDKITGSGQFCFQFVDDF